MAGSTIYNSTDGPLIIDRAGRVLGAREHLTDVDVDASPVAGHIAAGRVVIVEAPEQPDEGKATKGRRTSTPTTEEA